MRVSRLHPVGVLALAALLMPTATAAPLPPGSHTEKWIDLRAGQCVADLPPADGSRVDVTVVDCATAHLAEVYLWPRWPSTPPSPPSPTGIARPGSPLHRAIR